MNEDLESASPASRSADWDFTRAEPYEVNPGGAATVRKPLNLSASRTRRATCLERQLDFR
jgi:CxxC motif-containing protein (DUF1111 family)